MQIDIKTFKNNKYKLTYRKRKICSTLYGSIINDKIIWGEWPSGLRCVIRIEVFRFNPH